MRSFLSVILLMSFISAVSQDKTDLERMQEMAYLKYADKIDCDSTKGTTLEHRVCLNLEFQELEPRMNALFLELLEQTENDSMKSCLKGNHAVWIDNRRLQSEIMSEGYRGHMLGIMYLHCMVSSTRSKIEELEAILQIE